MDGVRGLKNVACIVCWFSLEGKGTLGKVDPILYYLMSLGSWDLPNMGDSIGDWIVTPYITNLFKQMSDDKNVLLAQHVCCFVLPFCRQS